MFTVWANAFNIASRQVPPREVRWDAPAYWRRPEPTPRPELKQRDD